MKILLTGATGYVGSEILKQCLDHNYIVRIYCLTRKPLEQHWFQHKNGEKITEMLHEDYENYPEAILRRLKDEGVEGCIWALGGNSIAQYKSLDEARRVGINYPIQCAEALARDVATGLSPQNMPKKKFPFRFVFISSWGAEQDQFRSLWIWNDSRKIKGAAEKGLFDIAEGSEQIQGHKCFEVISLRPGQVIAGGDAIGTLLWEATVPSIAVDRLGKAAINQVLMGTGDEKKRVVENKECLGDDWAMVNSFQF